MTSRHSSTQAILQQAAQRFQDGDYEGAIQGFTACLFVDPEEALAFQGRATARFQLKNWAGAAADFQRAKELNPDEKENWLGLGMSRAMQLEIYKALDILEAMLGRWPEFVRGAIQTALLQFKLGAIAKGRQLLHTALAAHPSKEERRLIESTLAEQNKLDKSRYYRPDFALLNKRRAS